MENSGNLSMRRSQVIPEGCGGVKALVQRARRFADEHLAEQRDRLIGQPRVTSGRRVLGGRGCE